jgi:hypothetical protein
MMEQISPPFRKALALTLLFAVLYLAATKVALPVAEAFTSYGESIERSQILLDRYRRLAAEEPMVKTRYKALRREAARSGLFLGAPTLELAAASLQARIGNSTRVSGVQLASVQMLAPIPAGDMMKVSARVTAAGSPQGLTRLIHNLETSPPYLFVDKIRISIMDGSGDGAAAAKTVVQAQFDIAGYNLANKP